MEIVNSSFTSIYGAIPDQYKVAAINDIGEKCVVLSIAGVLDQSTAEAWLAAYSALNYTTWRVLRTHHKLSGGVIFKVCH